MVIDDRLVLIATFNFCDKYFTLTRDYGLMSRRRRDRERGLGVFRGGLGGRTFDVPWSRA